MSRAHLPIGIFDSGLGGLTVLKALSQHLPKENFVYLGDTARLPYGVKSAHTIHNYLKQNINYLLSLKVKAIVVACNSASSVVDEDIVKHADVPVLEVIRPGSLAALKASKDKRIGVIGTRTTVAEGVYLKTLQELDPKVVVVQQACPLFVPLVEEGWVDDPLTNLVVYRYLNPIVAQGIDTLILGCTHYPVLKEAIAKVTGPHIELVDSAQTVATTLEELMKHPKAPLEPNPFSKSGKIHLMTTDANEGFESLARKILSPVDFDHLEQVDL